MDPQIEEYYTRQAGTGIAGYSGVRYQKGNGFFGRLITGAVLPVLRYLGRQALKTGANVAQDVLDGQEFNKAVKTNLNTSAREVAYEGVRKLKEMTGSGIVTKDVFEKSIKGRKDMTRQAPKKRVKKSIKATHATEKAPKKARLSQVDKLLKNADFCKFK